MELSVIVGAYNMADCFLLQKSIESVLNQTYSDFEFIICDDGSTDSTWDILCEYAEKDVRIKLLRNTNNLGLAASLNRCIAASTGEFIARHDLDDYNDLRRFEKQISYMKSHTDIGVLGCQSYLFNENGVWGKDIFPRSVTNKDFLFTSPYRHGSVVFRREQLLKAGSYRVAKETYRAEDYDLFMTMQTFCRGENLDEYLYYFCENDSTRKRRKYRYRLDEVKVRRIGFKKLGLMPKALPYVIKPLIVGFIPAKVLEGLKKKHYERKTFGR